MHKGTGTPFFVNGGGEMGALTRAYNWADTPLGSYDTWPQSLTTVLGILLHSKFPMFLWWGAELTCFYNDAYRPSLGQNGKHPHILGMPAKQAWPEIWHLVSPLITQVMEGGEATWDEDQLVPIYRNGAIEEVYWTFSYSPVINDEGGIGGVLVVCTETTGKMRAAQKMEETYTQYSFAVEAAELGTWDLDPVTNRFTGNGRLKEWFGLAPEEEIPLPFAIAAIAEKDRERVAAAIQATLQYSSGGHYDIEYTIVNAKTGRQRIVKATGKAFFNEDKKPYRFNGILQDITAEVMARDQNKKLSILVENSVDLMAILKLDGKNSYVNKAGRDILGIDEDADITQIPIADFHTPEQLAFVMAEIIPGVMTNGRWSGQFGVRNGKTGEIIQLFNNCHRIDDEKTGEPIGVGTVMRDMRPELDAQSELAANEERLNIAIEATELGMWELNTKTGYLVYNKRYLQIMGFDEDESPSHADIRARIYPQDVALRNRAIEESLKTGVLDIEFRIVHPGNAVRWIRGKGRVFYDAQGQPARQLGTIMDTTLQKEAAEAFRLSSERFQLLADSMPQFIWTGDATGNLDYYNQAVYDYSGLSRAEVASGGWLQIVHPDDRIENIQVWVDAVTSGKDFLFQHRFRRHDGEHRWQLSRALPLKGADGKIHMWIGTSTDIHEQKTMAQQLEQNVLERTRELLEANTELERKNKELASFAFVSSHDLQEPLRKINTFISRIEEHEAEALSAKGLDYFNKIKVSATRMQALIHDLLSFSGIDSHEKKFEPANINSIIRDVEKEVLETKDKKAVTVDVAPLPVLNIIVFQAYQLFANLLSNALKFAKKDVPPRITITGEYITTDKNYYCISVADNGIGFEPQFNTKIFEVFQRLHGRQEYEGTGIGLAICQKIMENHHGYITAEGMPGEGAVFKLYFPV